MKNFTKAALVADALNLGPHWIYNQGKIARLYPNGVKNLTDPVASYHGVKKAGQLTHTGDQIYFLYQSIEANEGAYELDTWKTLWVERMSSYKGYFDAATKATLEAKGESSSGSDEISGAGRCAPILDLDLSVEEMVQAARSQTGLTHGSTEVLELSEFIIRAVRAIEDGLDFKSAFLKASNEGRYSVLAPITHIQAAEEASTSNHLETAAKFGLTCHFPEAFPLTLYYALNFGESFEECLSLNALAGGDNTARGIILALFFAARDGNVGASLFPKLKLEAPIEKVELVAGGNSVTIDGENGKISGVLEYPKGDILATAVFAHCFTCGKDFVPEKRVTKALAERGIATLRIDFSGVGGSSGEFSDSSFLTNLDDIVVASDWLKSQLRAPSLLVGHSLGGAAVLASAKKISSVKAVATIGAPADPSHVTHLFEDQVETIKSEGQAKVNLAGRNFTIGKRFLDDLEIHNQEEVLSTLNGISTLIMHAPEDATVPLKNAGYIYSALPHPKSFVSLAGADHLLTVAKDANYVADLIKTWAAHLLSE